MIKPGPSLVAALAERVAQKLIRTSTSSTGLVIYSYTEKCTFSRAWDEYTEQARGLILTTAGEIVALPLRKFWNTVEQSCPRVPVGEDFEVFSKVDGSLGIFYHYDGQWNVATRGSFSNVYTEFASRYLPMFPNFPEHWTILVEICLPSTEDPMPRCVAHEPGLYLLAARDRNTGEDIPYDRCLEYWLGPVVERCGSRKIEELLESAKDETGTEGWVIRWDSGLRMKIKTAWYLKLFRAVSNLTEKHMKELLVEAGGFTGVVEQFPEELQAEAQGMVDAIQRRALEKMDAVDRAYMQINNEDRKTFALKAVLSPDRALLFKLYDGQDIQAMVISQC